MLLLCIRLFVLFCCFLWVCIGVGLFHRGELLGAVAAGWVTFDMFANAESSIRGIICPSLKD
jgi:hypothetical protein